MALDAATLALVANELNSTLLDAKIDKIFEPTRDEVRVPYAALSDGRRSGVCAAACKSPAG